MNKRGDDPPTDDNIEDFGLYTACQMTRGNFALYKPKEYAARGRVGMSPLYWNPETLVFSHKPERELIDFPPGYLFDVARNRLVCWENMYYDKPLSTPVDTAVKNIRSLIKDAIQFREDICDAFLLSAGCGSTLVNKYIDSEIWSYTVAYRPGYSIDGMAKRKSNRTTYFYDDATWYPNNLNENEIPMYILAKFLKHSTEHRKFMTGAGCTELFSNKLDFRPYVKHIVDQFAKFDLEVFSPFFDVRVIDYVLENTRPNDRPTILSKLLGDENTCAKGLEICDTVGDLWMIDFYRRTN